MPPKTVTWPLDPHTVGKHKVLKSYLDAWFPKLGTWAGRILFVDGFCGPGAYTGGEPGSPIIALDAYLHHSARSQIEQVVFLFGDENQARLDHLNALLKEREALKPQNCTILTARGDFNKQMTDILDGLDKSNNKMAPAFVMLDPFGVSDTPLSLVQRILGHPRSEVYISFMYESLNRFKRAPEFEKNLDGLFGCPDWRRGSDIEDPNERKNFFYDLYEKQLKSAGAEHVVRFELYNGNRLVYAIFFGTHSWHGSNAMKQAVWKVDPFGGFEFRGSRTGALFSSGGTVDYSKLEESLVKRFGGKGWVTIGTVEEFVGSDATDYHTGQLKTTVLKPMEQAGRLRVDEASRRKKFTYPSGTKLQF